MTQTNNTSPRKEAEINIDGESTELQETSFSDNQILSPPVSTPGSTTASPLISPSITPSTSMDFRNDVELPILLPKDRHSTDTKIHKKSVKKDKSFSAKFNREFIINLLKSFVYCFSFSAYGAVAGVLSWSTEKYQMLTKTGDAGIGWLFAARGMGYIFGTIISGFLYGKAKVTSKDEKKWYSITPHKIYAICYIICAIAISVVPLYPQYFWLLAIYILKGFCLGAMEVGGSIFVVWIWKKKADPWLLLINFFYGLGSLISPLIASPLLAERLDFIGTYIAHWIHAIWCLLVVIVFPFMSTPVADKVEKEEPQKYETIQASPKASLESQGDAPKVEKPPSSFDFTGIAVALLCGIYVCFSTGTLVTYSGLIYDFALKMQIADQQTAAYLTSAMWMAITIGRLITVPIAAFVNPIITIFICVIGSFISILLIAIFPNVYMVIICTVAFGIFLAPQNPTMIGFPQVFGVTVTSNTASLIIFCAAIGEMLLPILVTNLVPVLGPLSLIYLTLAAMLGSLIDFIIMVALFHKKGIIARFQKRKEQINNDDQNKTKA